MTRPVGADPGRIYADLSADALDLDSLPSLDASRSLAGGYDLALSLEARTLHLAHVGETGIDGGSLVVKLGRIGSRLTLDRLAVAGLGGASIEASGAAGPDGVTAAGRLEAAKLGDFAALVSRLALGRGPGRSSSGRPSCRRPRSPSRRAAGHSRRGPRRSER